MRDLALAFGFLTIVPVGRRWDGGPGKTYLAFFPWVGWFLGVVGVAVSLLGWVGGFTAYLVTGPLVVAVWGVLTRFLHWDALADSADGLLGGYERERKLEIMRDPRVGSFGAVAIVLVGLLQSAAVVGIVSSGKAWGLLVAAVLGRAAVSLASWTLPPARTDGLGASSVGKPSVTAVVIATLSIVGLGVPIAFSPVPVLVGFAVGLVAAVVVPRILARGIGGITGDTLGASILLVETVTLVSMALLG